MPLNCTRIYGISREYFILHRKSLGIQPMPWRFGIHMSLCYPAIILLCHGIIPGKSGNEEQGNRTLPRRLQFPRLARLAFNPQETGELVTSAAWYNLLVMDGAARTFALVKVSSRLAIWVAALTIFSLMAQCICV